MKATRPATAPGVLVVHGGCRAHRARAGGPNENRALRPCGLD